MNLSIFFYEKQHFYKLMVLLNNNFFVKLQELYIINILTSFLKKILLIIHFFSRS